MPSLEIMLLKIALQKYVHYICIYIEVKSSIPKHNLWAWNWRCKSILWNGTYRVSEKNSSYCVSLMESGWIGKVRTSHVKDRMVTSRSSQSNYLKIATCCFLAWHLASLGYGKDWLAQINVSEWDIRSCCWSCDFCEWDIRSCAWSPSGAPL